jgi:hypothetical protein
MVNQQIIEKNDKIGAKALVDTVIIQLDGNKSFN